jgi:hypothetical protein
MITLPASPAPNDAQASMIDFGVNLRGALGARTVRVDRPGNRFRAAISYPLMTPAQAAIFVSRLLRAKSTFVRMPWPLLGMDQGSPGSPVVNGAGQAGTAIALRGLTASYPIAEGFWLSIEGGGNHYLHNVTNAVVASGSGLATVNIVPALRFPFPDGAVVHLAQPMIDGFVDGESSDWAIRVDRMVQLGFTLEELG